MQNVNVWVAGAVLALAAGAQEIGFVETFSLAADREAALKELVPGTDDAYYYQALHAQNTGDRKRFQETLDRWTRARNGAVHARARELLNRQALLDYERETKKSLDYLRDELKLTFGHARKTGERTSTAPTALDPARLSAAALLKLALAEEPRGVERLEDPGLLLAADQPLTPEQRRSLLARLRRPDVPGLADLIAADLAAKESRGFGSLPIHRLLTQAQLDELLQKQPALRNQASFATAYLATLVPEDEVDLDTDPVAREAYYERVWAFVKTLEPAHNSLKANALYNRLRHDHAKGVYDRARFLEYVKLPRDVFSLRAEYRERVPHSNQFAQLGQDFSLMSLPPVPRDEPLVRDFLLAFFRLDEDIATYAPYLRDDYLKPLFAEAKIVNGVGDPQQWAPLLSPEAYKRLKERVDIDFAPDNPAVFGAADPVTLTAFVKNVPALLVKVYEINTFNYYRETGRPLNLAISLDGLVASVTRRVAYAEPSERRVARTFALPELKGRGVYVVELIGNGKSSRALVQKGRLNVLQEVTAAGHAFTVLDEAGARVAGASGWLGGRAFDADAEGRVLVPFSTAPRAESVVIRHDGFATLVRFEHLAETYALRAGVYVDRESLIRREQAQVAIRPVLTVNGRPVSLKLLEEPRLVIRSIDLQGIATEKEVADLKLREDAETVQEIQVPESCVSLTVALKGRVQNLSLGQKQELEDGGAFELNAIERTAEVQALHVGRHAGGYYVDARGKNGEPLAGEPLEGHFKHRCFRREVHVLLQTDASGRASLGALAGIEGFRLKAPAGRELAWAPAQDACAYPASLHGRAGETLRVPVAWDAADPVCRASLLEVRRGRFVKDWQGALALAGGFLELRDLPAGDYSLGLPGQARALAVRVTRGEARGGFVVSPRRALEQPRLAPLNVAAVTPGPAGVEIRLANATPFTRVHLFATRYLPAYDLFARLGDAGAPGLLAQPWQPARTFYESGRDIGDEYRYILDRQQAAKYPGNMLERPGLLLNPWALRTTEAEAERLAEGRDYAGRGAGLARAGGAAAAASKPAGVSAEGYAGLDFLAQPAVTLLNLVPDPAGVVVVPRAALKGLPLLRVLAVDPTASVLRCAALEDAPLRTRELRLANGLDPAQSYAERKRVTVALPGSPVTIGDVTTARFEPYDTVAKAYRLLATLNGDAAFAAFAFVADWPALDAQEQRRLYAKYACHELSFFLYHKDRAFFDRVIAPYLKNKKDKTFLDRWLLGDDLAAYLEPWRFGRLNAAERVLLGKRLREREAALVRDTRERVELLPPDVEGFNRRFDTALQTGALETEGGGAAGAVEELRRDTAEKQATRLAAFATADPFAPPAPAAPAAAAPAPAMVRRKSLGAEAPADGTVMVGAALEDKDGAVANALQEAAKGGLRQRGLAKAEAAETKAGEELEVAEALYFDHGVDKKRDESRRFYQKLDQTQEWAENNYWHQPIEGQAAELVKVNAFWRDYAAHDGRTPFLSPALPETATGFTEMMLALAVAELPFAVGKHAERLDGVSYTLTPGSPVLLFHREIGAAPRREQAGGMLVAQHFFRADDRERVENGERFDKLVTDEFLPRVVYGAQVVLTNPTGSRRKLHALLQIPMGAIAVNGGFTTRSAYVVLEPYSTQTQEYFFYFPSTGTYPHYPVTLADNDGVIGRAAPATFRVVAELSRVDTTSWAWLSQNGSEEELFAFLNAANLHRVALDEIAWRMKAKETFKRVTALLEARHLYNGTLWSYGVLHDDPAAIRAFLQHHGFADRCGLWLESPLLSLDPVARVDYQHLEYAPLVNPRAHQVGAARTILNTRFREQYQRFMRVLSYKPKVQGADALAVAYYLALQDRVEEALAWFAKVDRKAVPEQLQCDYLEAYLAFYTGDFDRARALAQAHAEAGVARWRDRFAQVLGQLDELAGGAGAAPDQEKRDQAQAALAASEPALELLVEAGRIRLDTRNLRACTVNFYPMDIELLFSRSPFMQEGAAQFSFIRPALTREVAVPAGQDGVTVELPPEFKAKNVMVEALGGGVRQTQAYYANTLKVQLVESYGQLVVAHAESGKPVPGAYVKVYAKGRDGKATFFKDGYTDPRGRFDYASLNTPELERAERLAVLVLSDVFGAVVREAAPPKR